MPACVVMILQRYLKRLVAGASVVGCSVTASSLQDCAKPVVSQSIRSDSVAASTDVTSIDGSLIQDPPLAGMVTINVNRASCRHTLLSLAIRF